MEAVHAAGLERKAVDSLIVSDKEVAEPVIQPRAYQIEMFEESVKRNVIVCVSRELSL